MIIKPTWIIIAVLLLYSVFTTYKIINDKPEIVTNTVVVPGDVVYRDTVIYQPKPYAVTTHDTVYTPKDSAQCVADYMELFEKYSATKQYSKIVQDDSSMTIAVNSTVGYNNLQSLEVKSKNNRKTIINTTTVTYKNKLPMLSLGVTYDMQAVVPYGTLRVNRNLYLVGGYNLKIKTPVIGLQYTILSK